MKNKKRSRLTLIVIAAVLVVAIGSASIFAGALWKEEEAVHINPDEIENSTLVIGAHLIHLSALSDPIYKIASDSAGESGQDQMFYKSELADGTWFNIDSAASLRDITTEGTPVENSVIAALFFTHHTKSDGITYDLRTNAAVSVVNIKNVYEITAMDELLPLKMQYDLITDSVGENDVAWRIKKLLTANLVDDTTKNYDKDIAALQVYLNVLNENNGGAAQQGVVQSIMEGVDAARRSYVLSKVDVLLQEYMQELSDPVGSKDKEAEVADTALVTAVADSMSNVQESLINYDGKKMSQGKTVFSSIRYRHELETIKFANDKNHASCDIEVAKILHLDNIQNDVISSRDQELALIKDELLPEASNRFTAEIKLGQSAEYTAEKANRAAGALLNTILQASVSQINTFRTELEFIITANCTRLGAEAGLKHLDERIELTKKFYSTVPTDGYTEGVNGTIDAHMEFLSRKKRELEVSVGGDEEDKLMVEKSDLNTQLRSALDKNDLSKAAEIEKKIAEVDKKIAEIDKAGAKKLGELAAKVNDLQQKLDEANAAGNTELANKLKAELGTAKGELAVTQAGMPDGSLGKQIATLKNASLAVIKADNPTKEQLAQLDSNINALNELLALDGKQTVKALAEIHKEMAVKDALSGNKTFADKMAKIEAAVGENTNSLAAALREEKNASDVSQAAKDFLAGNKGGDGNLLNAAGGGGEAGTGAGAGTAAGTGGKKMDPAQLADKFGQEITLLALQDYYDETKDPEILALLTSTAQKQINSGSLTVYVRLDSKVTEYVPLSAIHAYSGMRYIEDKKN
ncbi:MAG: hypothetical protein RSD32_05690, partial [Oscillospiraceae bacterium]